MAIKTPHEYKEMEYIGILLELARLLKPKTYVEIGVKKAFTFNQMTGIIPECYGIDIDASCASRISYRKAEDVKRIHFHHGGSKTFASYATECAVPLIDFLFIDGDHKWESVLKDLLALLPFVTPTTGLIFLHDTYPVCPELATSGYCSDAWRAARLIRLYYADRVEIVTLPGPWAGLSILRKVLRGQHLHWKGPEILEGSEENK